MTKSTKNTETIQDLIRADRDILKFIAQAPDGHLDKSITKELQELLDRDVSDDEIKKFLWNTLDKCVRYAAGSGVAIALLKGLVVAYPETEEEKAARREELLRNENG